MSKYVTFITLTNSKGNTIFVKPTSVLSIQPFRNGGSLINVNGQMLEVSEDKITVLEKIINKGERK